MPGCEARALVVQLLCGFLCGLSVYENPQNSLNVIWQAVEPFSFLVSLLPDCISCTFDSKSVLVWGFLVSKKKAKNDPISIGPTHRGMSESVMLMSVWWGGA